MHFLFKNKDFNWHVAERSMVISDNDFCQATGDGSGNQAGRCNFLIFFLFQTLGWKQRISICLHVFLDSTIFIASFFHVRAALGPIPLMVPSRDQGLVSLIDGLVKKERWLHSCKPHENGIWMNMKEYIHLKIEDVFLEILYHHVSFLESNPLYLWQSQPATARKNPS